MGELKDKYVRFDWAVKRLLRQKANFVVLEGFLTVFLGEEIKIIEILESEGNQESADDKFNRVDIKARNSKDEIILIEVQNASETFYLERMLYGVAKAITEHINIGQTYQEVKKVYSISIIYFNLGTGSDYIYCGQNHFVGIHTKDELKITARERNTIVQKSPEEIFPTYYLIRVNNFNDVAVSPMEEWMRYLQTGNISDEAKAPGLPEARKRLQYYAMSDAERHAYDEHVNAVMIQKDVIGTAKREGIAEGMAKGMAKGMAEGMAKEREANLKRTMDSARSMLKDGLSPEKVMRYTGLSEEEINALR